jgi:hypothetical protein
LLLCFFLLKISFNQEFQSYVALANVYIVCLTVDQTNDNLDLFRYELDLFTKELLANESINEIEIKLSSWYDKCVGYLPRCIDYLADKLGYFIEYALSGVQIDCQNELNVFYETITCKSLVEHKINVIKFNLNDNFANRNISKLAVECVKQLKEAQNEPFKQKEILEQVKLALVQDLNTFNRIVRRAENSYYDFYV